MGAENPRELPKIDFSGVDPASAGTESWKSVRAQVIQAMESHGCFEAIYPQVTPELRESLFRNAVKELFALPLDVKHRNIHHKPFHGYLGEIPALDYYESLAIVNAPLPHATQSFANLLWPETGNPTFCETVLSFSQKVAELEGMARRMLMEGLGVDKYYEDLTNSMWYLLRFAEYQAPAAQEEEEKKLGYVPHRDTNTMSVVCQLQKDGLEVQAKDGEWILASPSPISFIVMAGNGFRAWTNGRVGAALHRILVGGGVTRYSVVVFSVPKGDFRVEAPPELVDEDHPPLFEPYNDDEFVRFCVSEEGTKTMDTLAAYTELVKARKAEAQELHLM